MNKLNSYYSFVHFVVIFNYSTAIFFKITSKSIFNSMFICICRAKEEEDDEIRTNFADDKLNSKCVIFLLYMCGDFKI